MRSPSDIALPKDRLLRWSSSGSGRFLCRSLCGQFDNFRRGLTLVELLAAIVLSTLLMGAVLGVLTSVTKGQKVILQNHGIAEPWQTRLEEMLTWDLGNSRSFRNTETGVLLEGFAGRDLSTRIPIHCPSVIEYAVVSAGKRKHLIRRETHTELLNLDNSYTDLIGLDVEQLVVGAPLDSVNSSAAVDSIKGLPDGPIPNRVSVTLLPTAQSSTFFSRTINLR